MTITRAAYLLAAGFAVAGLAASAEERQQPGAHVHGRGLLNVAIEGKRLSMELEVPAADIVGFEHEPSTPAQKAAIPQAKARLANALTLFIPAPQAGCELDQVKVSVRGEHEGEHKAEALDKAAGEDKAGNEHSEFHAEYSLTCSSPSKLTSISFDYFNAFASAQELAVTVIGPKGQSSYEVKRDKPTLDLAGVM